MRAIRVGFTALFCAWAATASAQVTPPPVEWTRATELNVHGGFGTTAAATGPMLGGAVAWDVNRWITLDGRGSWFDRGPDATGFAIDANALVNLVAKQTATPYVGAGVGLYLASFQSTTSMSSFYRDRVSPNAPGTTNTFTDPMVRLMAGIDLAGRTHHWTCRPEIAALIVFANGTSETMFSGSVSIGYQFWGTDRGNARQPSPPQDGR